MSLATWTTFSKSSLRNRFSDLQPIKYLWLSPYDKLTCPFSLQTQYAYYCKTGFSSALLPLFPLRKSTLYSNTAWNSEYGQYTGKTTTVQSNEIIQAMLKSWNTDWSFPITDMHNKMFAFSFYVNFLQRTFSPSSLHISQKPPVTEVKLNKNEC